MSRSPVDTGPAVSTDFAYVTDDATTGVLVPQVPAHVGLSVPAPTTALSTVPVASAFTRAV